MTPNETSNAAQALLAARRSGRRYDPAAAAAAPALPGDAYAIQAEVAAALGAVGGWKIGAASPQGEAFHAPLPAAGVLASGARLDDGPHRLRGVEVEVGYRLAADLPPREGGHDAESVAAAVDAIVPIIEIVETRFVDRDAAAPMWLLADNQSHGELVVGDAIADWRDIDVAAPHVTIAYDGRSIIDRVCRNAGGDPFDMVVRLANQSGTHCGGLRAGQIVTTGSLMGVDFAPPGAAVEATVAGVGSVRVTFVAR